MAIEIASRFPLMEIFPLERKVFFTMKPHIIEKRPQDNETRGVTPGCVCCVCVCGGGVTTHLPML